MELLGRREEPPVETGEFKNKGEGNGGKLERDTQTGDHGSQGEGCIGVHHHEHPVDEELLGAS